MTEEEREAVVRLMAVYYRAHKMCGPRWKQKTDDPEVERRSKGDFGRMRAALQAIEQSGFWLAPVTPTEEMVEVGGLQLYREDRNGGIPFDGNYRPHATATYKAMQSAFRSSSRKG